MRIFDTLMATRLTRIAPEHVTALNMIDLAFSGICVFGRNFPSKTERSVLESWRAYLDHLNNPASRSAPEQWNPVAENLFVELLYAISHDVGYAFDKVQIKNACYRPVGHGNVETELNIIREYFAKLASGEKTLNMNVTGLPVNQDFLKSQLDLHAKMDSVLTGKSAIVVRVDDNKGESKGTQQPIVGNLLGDPRKKSEPPPKYVQLPIQTDTPSSD